LKLDDSVTVFKEINERLATAAANGEFDEIMRLARAAKEWGTLEEQEKQIVERKKNLIVALQQNSGPTIVHPAPDPKMPAGSISPQQRGNGARAKFLQHLATQGVVLRRLGGKKYRTNSGLSVGIPYASELDIRPDSWFLGLADERFDIVVLLCDTASGEKLEFFLPTEFVKEIWNVLSRSHGQVKFHVLRAGSTYELRIPGGQLRPITQYLNNTKILSSSHI
jgi:hypothetical protein